MIESFLLHTAYRLPYWPIKQQKQQHVCMFCVSINFAWNEKKNVSRKKFSHHFFPVCHCADKNAWNEMEWEKKILALWICFFMAFFGARERFFYRKANEEMGNLSWPVSACKVPYTKMLHRDSNKKNACWITNTACINLNYFFTSADPFLRN